MDETRFDKIEIKELEIFANHGVYPEENVLGQKFVISATLFTHTRQAGLTPTRPQRARPSLRL